MIWADGTRTSSAHTLLQGTDGRGLLAVSLGLGPSDPPHPPTQEAVVEIATLEGVHLRGNP